MYIEGEELEITITVDSEYREEILEQLFEIDGVKSIDPEDSDYMVDSLSVDNADEDGDNH